MSTWATWDEVWEQITDIDWPYIVQCRLDGTNALFNVALEGFTEDGFWYLCDAVYYLYESLVGAFGYYDDVDPLGCDTFAAIFYAKSGGVTMQSMLEAMLKADFPQLKQFVGIEDAYRATIWDQPFESQFYADLVRNWRT